MATVEAMLEWADAQVGYVEGENNDNVYAALAGHLNHFSWCASFLVAGARAIGLELPSESAYTPTMAQGFQHAGRWHRDPQVGDFSFWDWPNAKHRIEHVELVVELKSGGLLLTDIGGNTQPDDHGNQSDGGGVRRRHRARTYCVGFGRPDYRSAVPVPPPAPPMQEDDDEMFCFRDVRDGKVWMVCGRRRWHIQREELDAYIAVGAVKAPVQVTAAQADAFFWRHPEVVG